MAFCLFWRQKTAAENCSKQLPENRSMNCTDDSAKTLKELNEQ